MFSTRSLAVLLLASASAGLLPSRASAQTPADVQTRVVASGLSGALFVTHVPGDRDRLFVVQQGGIVRVIDNGTLLPTPFLRISVRTGGERGLLGLAFPDDHATTGHFFVSYTRPGDGASVLERFTVLAGNPDVADPNSGVVFYGPVAQPYGNHNGGCIQFGPDGYLYFGLGDGGSANDPGCRSQNLRTPLGKMLRLDVSGNGPAVAPASNPFVNDPNALDEIWSLGLRNPWRFAFDPANGDLYIGDVGQNRLEEIDYQPASSTGGENWGWKVKEGSACFSTSACAPGTPSCASSVLVDPIHEYTHSVGCSVTGGVVYRGSAVPSLRGKYFFGDYCSGTVWSFRVVNGRATEFVQETRLGRFGGLTSFGQDADGEIYVCSGGAVRKVVPRLPSSNDLGMGTPGSNGIVPRFEMRGLLSAGESAEFVLSDAAPNAVSALLVGDANNPVQGPFGTVVPNPLVFFVPTMTDAQGRASLSAAGGSGTATVYAQWLVEDAGGPNGAAISNALEIFVF